jgi:hypothetical protein
VGKTLDGGANRFVALTLDALNGVGDRGADKVHRRGHRSTRRWLQRGLLRYGDRDGRGRGRVTTAPDSTTLASLMCDAA